MVGVEGAGVNGPGVEPPSPAGWAILPAMNLPVAGRLLSAAERAWNLELANPMLTESADVRLDLPQASMAEVARAVLDALDSLEARR